jgi:bacterioferritin
MNRNHQNDLLDMLVTAYNMEVETATNYLANSIWLDGIRAEHVKEALAADVNEELGHAQRLARRIKILDGRIPGSQTLSMNQSYMQPPESSIDLLQVIRGVIQAEDAAIRQYQAIIEATEGGDLVTQDLAINLKADEEEHRRRFVGFLMEAEAMAGVR